MVEDADEVFDYVLKPLKKFPKGIYRLTLVLWLATIVSVIFYGLADRWDADEYVIGLSIWVVAYYIIARLTVFVYLGFKEKD